MTVTTDVTRTGDTVTGRFTIKNLPTLGDVAKPAYAFAGLADLAIEQVKDAPSAYVAEVRKASERLAEVPSAVRTLPTQVRELRGEVETRLTQATEKADELYAALAVRGQRLVTQIRRQPAVEAAVVEGKEAVQDLAEAVKDVEDAASAATKSAKAGGRAARGAAKKIG